MFLTDCASHSGVHPTCRLRGPRLPVTTVGFRAPISATRSWVRPEAGLFSVEAGAHRIRDVLITYQDFLHLLGKVSTGVRNNPHFWPIFFSSAALHAAVGDALDKPRSRFSLSRHGAREGFE